MKKVEIKQKRKEKERIKERVSYFKNEIKLLKEYHKNDKLYTDFFENEITAFIKKFAILEINNTSDAAFQKIHALITVLRNSLLNIPLTDLKDNQDGFEDSSNNNTRYKALTKDGEDVYSSEAIVFVDAMSRTTFLGEVDGFKSTQKVKFPFYPKSFKVIVARIYLKDGFEKKDEVVNNDETGEFVFRIVGMDQLRGFGDIYDISEEDKLRIDEACGLNKKGENDE